MLGQGPDAFEYKIPSGWTLRDAFFSESGWKGLLIWQDVESLAAYRGEFSSKLLVFDKQDQLIKELTFDKPKFLKLTTRDDPIILEEGREEIVTKMTVVDREGTQLFERSTSGRSPFPALLGKEIALAQYRDMGPSDLLGAITMIDARTGRDLATFESSGTGIAETLTDVLPIGAEGLYLAAGGTSIALRTYLPPELTMWRIPNVGGNVSDIIPLDERYVGVAYHISEINTPNPGDMRFLGGVVVLDWRLGNVVFRQESRDPRLAPWNFLHAYGANISLMDGDLFFTVFSAEGGGGIRVAKSPSSKMRWDAAKVRSYRMTNARGDDNLICGSRWTMKSSKDVVRVERILFGEEK